MTEDEKPEPKRNTPTQLKISEESMAALKARLNSEGGQQWLNEFAKLIVDWATTAMPMELLQCLGPGGDLNTLEEHWPDIVDAYFEALGNPALRK